MFWNYKNDVWNKNFEEINRKHEMFWNLASFLKFSNLVIINRKHEMFWNLYYELLIYDESY